jgi:hypothetical protein
MEDEVHRVSSTKGGKEKCIQDIDGKAKRKGTTREDKL